MIRSKEYYEWDVGNWEITEKLLKLKQMIDAKGIEPEEFDYCLVYSPYYQELVQRQNRMFRAIARELRELRKQVRELEAMILVDH